MQTKISKNPKQADQFELPSAPGKPDRGLKIKLGKGKSAKYDVWQKDIPADAPTTVTIAGDSAPSPVTWFNNYGMKLRKNNVETTPDDPYENTLDHEYTVEVSVEPGKRFLVHTGGSSAKPMKIVGDKATVKLNLGDPLVGCSP